MDDADDLTAGEVALRQELEARSIADQDELQARLRATYSEVCGSAEASRFDAVLGKLSMFYNGNICRAGERGLEIIADAGSLPQQQLANYLSGVLDDELRQPPPPSLDQVKAVVCQAIREGEELFRPRFQSPYNVVGIVVYGSYARGQMHPYSDLDVIYLTRWPDAENGTASIEGILGMDTFDPKTDFAFTAHLDERLSKALSIELDTFKGDVCLDDTDRLRKTLYGPDSVVEGNFVLITPYAWVKEQFERQIKDE